MSIKHPRFHGWSVVLAAWLAVFCLFGYRATFAILKEPMALSLGWSASQVTLGYSLMMVLYALTAFFSGMLLDRFGTKPVYALAAVFGGLGFIITSWVDQHFAYLVSFGFLGGIATGMLWVSSTISVRKWYVGKRYASMWGIAFSGGPMAQFLLARFMKPALGSAQSSLNRAVSSVMGNTSQSGEMTNLNQALNDPMVRLHPGVQAALVGLDQAWRSQMFWLGLLVFGSLVVAVVLAKKAPEDYGLSAFGSLPVSNESSEIQWSVKAAFRRYAIWAAILTFLTSMMAEFLIWTQVISFWIIDGGYSLEQATAIYASIGLVGIVSMPLMGRLADQVVLRVGQEAPGRKVMLIVGPGLGVLACFLLLQSRNIVLAYAACVLFAVYWAIVPGGVVGYTGAVYGRKTLGKVWGLATLIVMGIGPFLGSFLGSWFKDVSGSYLWSIWFALGSFGVSALLATTLPLKVEAVKEQ